MNADARTSNHGPQMNANGRECASHRYTIMKYQKIKLDFAFIRVDLRPFAAD
jgi:hypothetical protein